MEPWSLDPLLLIAGAIIAGLFLREDKAMADVGYRFYALCDKISRPDILARAYAPSAVPTRAHDTLPQRLADRPPVWAMSS